ncbi:MAG TPA: AI-2E family transporter [Candidatus Polarisedimenticolia bacterium]|jgi:predicted PurR-regulated permease PerM|nr:AI-2E family transporter [Candidatus Polarisedimenticolia bacterium]
MGSKADVWRRLVPQGERQASSGEEPGSLTEARDTLQTDTGTGASPGQEKATGPLRPRLRWPLTLLTILLLVFTLQTAKAFLIPLVLGTFISYTLEPVVRLLVRLRIPRSLAVTVLMLGLLVLGGVTVYNLRDEAMQAVDVLPEAARRLRLVLRAQTGISPIEKVQEAATQIEKAATETTAAEPPPQGVMRVQVEQPPFRAADHLLWGGTQMLGLTLQAVIVFFFVFFLLLSGDLFRRKMVKIVGPALSKKKMSLLILEDIDRQITRYLLVTFFKSATVGLATWGALTWLGVQQAAFWGLIAAVFNTIPYFGPLAVNVAVGIVAFLQFGTLSMTAAVAGVVLLIATLEGWLLAPWLTGLAVRMNQVAVFIGLFFWSWIWGVAGMLLAVPMMTAMKAVCDRVDALHPIGELLGE